MILACAMAIATGLLAGVTPAGAQDLFSMIFGGRHLHPTAPWDRPARPRVRRAKPVLDEAQRLAARAALESYKVAPADMGTLRMFLNDRSLARGDIVVTSSGFKVFRGSPTFPYAPSDFVPLQTSNVRNLAQLKALEATVSTAHTAIDDLAPKAGARKPR